MSEVTTGSVALSILSLPVAAGAACISAAKTVYQYCKKKINQEIDLIRESEKRLKWVNEQINQSPKKVMKEAKQLYKSVVNNQHFKTITSGMNIYEKNLLASAIVTENSPIKSTITDAIKEDKNKSMTFNNLIDLSAKKLAVNNLKYVNKIVKEAAIHAGFNTKSITIKQSNSVSDIIFTDKEGRKLTAYSKLNKEMNPSLALDLEGFKSDSDSCTSKMNEIVKYLNSKGVPFKYKRIKHNNPTGVLRKAISKKEVKNISLQEYLQNSDIINKNLQKN